MTTLDSVEAELAAAHEAAELHREVVRHQAEEIARLTLERDRALACEAAARGLLKSLAETILNIEGDRTSRGHEARSEAVIRACVRALSSPPSPTSAEGARCECCTGTEECCRCDDDCETGRARMAAGRDPTDCRPLPAPPSAPPSGVCNGCGNTVPLEEGADGFMRLTSHDGGECFYSYTLDWEPPPTSEVAP